MEILNNLDGIIQNILINLGLFGPILACFLILLESIIAVLPLSVFITLNFLYFGNIIGFFISWIFTIIGCYISFSICRNKLSNWFWKKIDDKEKVEKLMISFSNIKFGSLVVLIALPFTPAFLVNIAAGLSTMNKRKFMSAAFIGKAFIVYFWGYVGTSLIDSIKDPIILLRIGFLLAIAYVISRFINKILKID